MHFNLTLLISFIAISSARIVHQNIARATNCFLVGTNNLPTEIINLLPSLSDITCNKNVQVRKGIPDTTSNGITFSTIDFSKRANSSPLAFALDKFSTPDNPKLANLTLFQNQLNVYLATEVGLRSQGSKSSSQVALLKVPKFFLQFQIARIQGNAVKVKHQGVKVLKNAIGATKDQIAIVKALETCF